MPAPLDQKQAPDSSAAPAATKPALSEDWLAVILAFLLILLSAIGLLGPNGIKIVF